MVLGKVDIQTQKNKFELQLTSHKIINSELITNLNARGETIKQTKTQE